jgi:hygromycin-B 7''-O-kinase
VLLPNIASLEAYRRVYRDPRTWLPAVRELGLRHRLPGTPRRETLGTHVVFGFEDLILKLYYPLWPQDYGAERAALGHLQGLPTPGIVAEGELEGWPYLVLTRLEGVPAATVWSTLPPQSKREVVWQLGVLIARLHEQPVPRDWPDKWGAFIRKRLERAAEHHGQAEPWCSWIREQLAGFCEPPFAPVLLHGDLTDDHLLLVEQEGDWTIGGVIDFGDARIGHPYYDLVAPLACYTYGRPELSLELVQAYGLEPSRPVLDALTRYCLLHEFGKLGDFLARVPVDSPQAFYLALWGQEP